MYTVVVKNPQGSELCLGLWYQPVRVSSGRAVEHKPYASVLQEEGRVQKSGDIRALVQTASLGDFK